MVKYRLAGEADYENINRFYNRIYNTNRTMEQFYWEFHHAPAGKSVYVVADDEGKIVGTNCVIPFELVTADGQTIRSGKSEDTLVDPDYRGQKIFYHIYQYLFEKCEEAGIQLIWGFTSAKKPFKKLGFEIPYDHEQSLAVNKIGGAYRYLSSLNVKNGAKEKFKIFGLCVYSKLKTLGRLKASVPGFTVREEGKLVQGVEELIQANLKTITGGFAIQQHAQFQEWRMYSNPNYHKVHTYGIYNAAEELQGMVSLNSHPNQTAYIVQSIFHPGIAAAERVKLLQAVTRKMFDGGISLIRNWHFATNAINQAEIKQYTDAQYIHLKRGIGLVWKELGTLDVKPEAFLLSRIATQGVI